MSELERKAKELLNLADAFNHNQALLDIGALICVSKNAKCGICPLYDFCQGKFNTELYPGIKKTSYENANLSLFVFEWDKNLLYKKVKISFIRVCIIFLFLRKRKAKF